MPVNSSSERIIIVNNNDFVETLIRGKTDYVAIATALIQNTETFENILAHFEKSNFLTPEESAKYLAEYQIVTTYNHIELTYDFRQTLSNEHYADLMCALKTDNAKHKYKYLACYHILHKALNSLTLYHSHKDQESKDFIKLCKILSIIGLAASTLLIPAIVMPEDKILWSQVLIGSWILICTTLFTIVGAKLCCNKNRPLESYRVKHIEYDKKRLENLVKALIDVDLIKQIKQYHSPRSYKALATSVELPLLRSYRLDGSWLRPAEESQQQADASPTDDGMISISGTRLQTV